MNILLSGTYNQLYSNNYTSLLADAYIKKGHSVIFEEQNIMYSNFLPDIVHIQWPEAFYNFKKLISKDEAGLKKFKKRIKYYRKHEVKIVYTVHNLLPHESKSAFDKKIYSFLLKNADLIVHHGKNSIKSVKSFYPSCKNKKHIVAPHGSYPVFSALSKQEARKKYNLPLDKIIFTSFGFIKRYKGEDFSKNVFEKMQKEGVFLFVIGRNIGEDEGVKCDLSFYKKQNKSIQKEEIANIMSLSDVVFLGHQSGLNSGMINLALSYNKPIVFPNIGNFKEQTRGFNCKETYKVGDENSARQAIEKIVKKINILHDNKKWLKKNSWQLHVEKILKNIHAF